MRGALAGFVVLAACASRPARPAIVDTSPPPETKHAAPEAPAPEPSAAPPATGPAPIPHGPASLGIHVERGKRQPLNLVGTVESIVPPRGSSGLDAWFEVRLGGNDRFWLDIHPPDLGLPFVTGERVAVEIDCRKGGWSRVCDGVVRDMKRTTLVIVSGSGSDDVASGWRIERGAVATSEVFPGQPKTVRHTYALRFEREGAAVTALPDEWRRLSVHGRSWLVTGYEEIWEGPRPPDARRHRAFSIVLER